MNGFSTNGPTDPTTAGVRTRSPGTRQTSVLGLVLVLLTLLSLTPSGAEAQGRGNDRGAGSPLTAAGITLSVDIKSQIRQFYAVNPVAGAKPLPPGIRRNLARGKPLPPGIAKRTVSGELLDRIHLPRGYHLVEVGLDVFLVEVATDIIHDFLMDVIR